MILTKGNGVESNAHYGDLPGTDICAPKPTGGEPAADPPLRNAGFDVGPAILAKTSRRPGSNSRRYL
jgi:hypothetical protein